MFFAGGPPCAHGGGELSKAISRGFPVWTGGAFDSSRDLVFTRDRARVSCSRIAQGADVRSARVSPRTGSLEPSGPASTRCIRKEAWSRAGSASLVTQLHVRVCVFGGPKGRLVQVALWAKLTTLREASWLILAGDSEVGAFVGSYAPPKLWHRYEMLTELSCLVRELRNRRRQK